MRELPLLALAARFKLLAPGKLVAVLLDLIAAGPEPDAAAALDCEVVEVAVGNSHSIFDRERPRAPPCWADFCWLCACWCRGGGE